MSDQYVGVPIMITRIATLAGAGLFALASASSAATSFDVSDGADLLGTITCDDCKWLDSGGDYSFADGMTYNPGPAAAKVTDDPLELYVLNPDNSDINNEVAHLNALLEGDATANDDSFPFDVDDFIKDESGSLDTAFNDPTWLILKFGTGKEKNDTAFILVYSGSISYEGKGLSHVTYDPTSEIPIPGSLPILMGGLGLLAFVRRKRAA